MTFYTVEDSDEFWEGDALWDAGDLDVPREKLLSRVSGRKEPSPWSLIWKNIHAHNRVYTAVAQAAHGPQIPILREFFQRWWDPVYFEAMEIQAAGGRDDRKIRSLVDRFIKAREQAWRIGLGMSADGTFYPKTDRATIRALRLYQTYGPIPATIPLTVAGEHPMSPAFRASLVASISDDHILTVEGCYGGRCVSTSIDLKPIAAQVKEMIRRYHLHALHGDMQEDTIAGLGDWYRESIRAAARIAHAKAAKRLWMRVQANYGPIEKGLLALGPYGQIAAIGVRTGQTIQRMLVKAKSGDPGAVEDVRAIVKLSKQGDPSAQQVTEIMRTMNEMGKIKDEKAPISVSGWLFNRPYRATAIDPGLALRGLYNLGAAS